MWRAHAARMGLQQPRASASASCAGVRVKRKAAPTRDGPVWKSVNVTRQHDTTPAVQCNNCGKQFCGGSTRIEMHILEQCTCETDTFLEMKQNLIAKREQKDEKKKQKQTIEAGDRSKTEAGDRSRRRRFETAVRVGRVIR